MCWWVVKSCTITTIVKHKLAASKLQTEAAEFPVLLACRANSSAMLPFPALTPITQIWVVVNLTIYQSFQLNYSTLCCVVDQSCGMTWITCWAEAHIWLSDYHNGQYIMPACQSCQLGKTRNLDQRHKPKQASSFFFFWQSIPHIFIIINSTW
jgi:hypothetical protein